jgi:hypothetical protein
MSAYFSQIRDDRRFSVEGYEDVFAVYDASRSFTLYAPVGVDASGTSCFVGAPRPFFDDEITEL